MGQLQADNAAIRYISRLADEAWQMTRGILMLSLDDPRWPELQGGYRIPYDASTALRQLEQGADVWDELWENLHHQGDVGEASYAAVPHLVRIAAALPARDWNFYGLIATIEVERQREENPELPEWLVDDYAAAMQGLLKIAAADLLTVDEEMTLRSMLGAIALAKGDLKLGTLISYIDDSEIDAMLDPIDDEELEDEEEE